MICVLILVLDLFIIIALGITSETIKAGNRHLNIENIIENSCFQRRQK